MFTYIPQWLQTCFHVLRCTTALIVASQTLNFLLSATRAIPLAADNRISRTASAVSFAMCCRSPTGGLCLPFLSISWVLSFALPTNRCDGLQQFCTSHEWQICNELSISNPWKRNIAIRWTKIGRPLKHILAYLRSSAMGAYFVIQQPCSLTVKDFINLSRNFRTSSSLYFQFSFNCLK